MRLGLLGLRALTLKTNIYMAGVIKDCVARGLTQLTFQGNKIKKAFQRGDMIEELKAIAHHLIVTLRHLIILSEDQAELDANGIQCDQFN